MEKVQTAPRRGGYIIGFVFLLAGFIWLLREMGVSLPWWLFTWQMLLVVIGLAIGFRSNFREKSGYLLIGIGIIFLLNDIYDWHFSFRDYFWPILLMVIGLMILLRRGKSQKVYNAASAETLNTGTDNFENTAIFTGTKKHIDSTNFNRGSVTVVFGGSEINMMHAGLQGSGVIDVTVVFGGLEIIVPSDWRVEVGANAILGAIEDKRYNPNADPNKVLHITGIALFGGVEIKSY